MQPLAVLIKYVTMVVHVPLIIKGDQYALVPIHIRVSNVKFHQKVQQLV
jgi:hypothetical protein